MNNYCVRCGGGPYANNTLRGGDGNCPDCYVVVLEERLDAQAARIAELEDFLGKAERAYQIARNRPKIRD